MHKTILLGAALVLLTFQAMGSTIESGDNRMRITQVADGFDTPWALAFLPEGGVLVTEREGRLWILGPDDGRTRIDGVPRVRAQGQGGLLDVMVPRDFGQSREVFLSYSKPQENGGAGTALAVGWLNAARNQLENLRVLFEMRPGSRGGRHFGSRIVEAPDGTIFLTIGERGDRPSAQDLTRHNGSIVRVRRDGSVPEDNPFTDHAEAQPEIWSYGHRNPQGAALDLEGQLWAVEHGARGGDEINRIQRGANYGWPVVSYGTHYSGEKIGEGTSKEGMEQPAFYWDPSIAPSGMMIYSGKLWPDWRGQMFIGSLKFDHISRLGGEPIKELDRMSSDETERVRDVIEAPDGSIWFISEGRGAIYRLDPQ